MADPKVRIPIVDFGVFLGEGVDGVVKEKEKVAREIDTAFRHVGFVYLRNHGVGKETLDGVFAWSKRFFDLPLETKMLAPHPPGGSHHRGYSAPGVEKVSQFEYDANELAKIREIPDLKESFESGNINDTAQPNIWLPDEELPGFRAFMETYFTACEALIHKLLDALSLALAVPHPGLSQTHSQSLFQLRLLHYPAIEAKDLQSGKIGRINAHSDFGTLTLLFQDSVGGLEVEDPHHAGVFKPAEPIEGTMLVNVGDLLARWSNDRWRSTVHRVRLPQRYSKGTEDGGTGEENTMVPSRYSIPVFATADPDTVIDALPGCWDELANPKKYESVTAWGYVQMRMAALYEG